MPKVCVSSQSRPVALFGRPRPPQPTWVRFSSLGQNSSGSAAKMKLRTRLLVTLLFGGGLMSLWWFVHLEKQQKLRRLRVEQLQKVAVGQGNFSLVDHRYDVSCQFKSHCLVKTWLKTSVSTSAQVLRKWFNI